MEEILEAARKVAEEAEIFWVSSEQTPIRFEANRLKGIDSRQSTGVSLRLVKNGRLGYAAASGEIDIQQLIGNAIETSQFGLPAEFTFPSRSILPKVEIFDPSMEAVTLAEMVELGKRLIDPVRASTPGIICEAGISRDSGSVRIMNSCGFDAEYHKTTFALGVSGTLVQDTDMLFVGEGQESCHPLRDTGTITETVLRQLQLAKHIAKVRSGRFPVIFTPDGLFSAFIPSLMSAFSGKTVLEGASPIGKRLGEKVFDSKLTLHDDPTLGFAPNSRPFDDEGVPSQRTTLIKKGEVSNFLYDLQTAGQAKVKSTGNGSRGRGGVMSPSPSGFIFDPGDVTFEEMVQDIEEGLVIEQLMGAEQGNVLGGDFSGNVLLGYKIEKGELVGRVKNTMVSGNVYQILKEVVSLGKDSKWVGGALFAPHIFCPSLSVASN
jgi:PmbA protein